MAGFLIVTAIVSLFLQIELPVAGAKLRPFDGLVLAMMLHLLFVRGVNLRLPLGLQLCGLFFLVHAASALSLGPGSFAREGVQVCIMLLFGLYLYNTLDAGLLRRCLPVLTALLFAVMLYNILWHLSLGHMTGWKHLHAPKMAFLFLPVLLTYYALKHQREPGPGSLAATILLPLMLPILLLSGERKALLFFLICGLIYLVRAKPFLRPAGWLAILVSLLVSLPLIPALVEIPYVQQQIDSVLSPFSSAELVIYSKSEYFAESLSNAQRAFSNRVGLELFASHPILGVGTNAFQATLRADYAYLPSVMLKSIHSDFLRVLVENGVVGLVIYSIVPLRALLFLLSAVGSSRWSSRLDGLILFFIAATILLAMESTGSKLMVPYVLLALLPDMARRSAAKSPSSDRSPLPARLPPSPSWQAER